MTEEVYQSLKNILAKKVALPYVMEHSDVGVTLNVYTHASYDRTAEQMAKILDFKEADLRRFIKKYVSLEQNKQSAGEPTKSRLKGLMKG